MKFEFENEEPIEAKDADEASELYFNRYQNDIRELMECEDMEVSAICDGITYNLFTESNLCCEMGCTYRREYYGVALDIPSLEEAAKFLGKTVNELTEIEIEYLKISHSLIQTLGEQLKSMLDSFEVPDPERRKRLEELWSTK